MKSKSRDCDEAGKTFVKRDLQGYKSGFQGFLKQQGLLLLFDKNRDIQYCNINVQRFFFESIGATKQELIGDFTVC